MTTVPLTEELMAYILSVQSFGEWMKNHYHYMEASTGAKIGDWREMTKAFMFGNSDEALKRIGLAKNVVSFNAVMDFKVTDEMKATEFKKLPEMFTFTV